MLLEKKQKEKTFARRVLYLTIGTAIILLTMLLNSCTKKDVITGEDLKELTNKAVVINETKFHDAIPWTTGIYDSCTNENVNCTGFAVFKNTLNGIRIISAYIKLDGVGEITGNHYRGVYKSVIQDNYPNEIKAVYMFTFRSETGNTFSFSQREHCVFNEDGTIKMDIFSYNTNCKP